MQLFMCLILNVDFIRQVVLQVVEHGIDILEGVLCTGEEEVISKHLPSDLVSCIPVKYVGLYMFIIKDPRTRQSCFQTDVIGVRAGIKVQFAINAISNGFVHLDLLVVVSFPGEYEGSVVESVF